VRNVLIVSLLKFEILQNHAPIVSALSKGEVRIVESNGEKKSFKIQKGFIEVIKNEVSILVTGVTAG
jgi:F-type H+-transporting ATPase subunit epsilon